VRLHNVPEISDVRKLLDLLRSLGVQADAQGTTVTLNAKTVNPVDLDRDAVKTMRSSILLIGALLARTGKMTTPEPGGCFIGSRPIDAHISAIEQLGGTVKEDGEDFHFTLKRSGSTTVVLPEFSVTATENAILASVRGAGTVRILQAAAEPHVQDLCNFLNAMGARISGIGGHELLIESVRALHGGEYGIIPDCIEVGTFAALGTLQAKELELAPIRADHLTAVFDILRRMGAVMEVEEDRMRVKRAKALSAVKLQTLPYPGFPTDLQAPFTLLATQAEGISLVHDPLYEARFGYALELKRMGAEIIQADPHRIIVQGPTPLIGQHIKSLDLRAGITLLLAGLIAQGESVVERAEIVDRGYSRIVERLTAVGAVVERQDEENGA
jgi:UDP-N-acetylglucosamine 1-carboxyvinyltransferase